MNKVIAGIAASTLLGLSLFAGSPAFANPGGDGDPGNGSSPEQITVCHATGSAKNPYSKVSVPEQSAHLDREKHPDDIILPGDVECPDTVVPVNPPTEPETPVDTPKDPAVPVDPPKDPVAPEVPAEPVTPSVPEVPAVVVPVAPVVPVPTCADLGETNIASGTANYFAQNDNDKDGVACEQVSTSPKSGATVAEQEQVVAQTPSQSTHGDQLANTGAEELIVPAGIALLILLSGVGLVLLNRRTA